MFINVKNTWKNVKAICFGIFIGLIICEIILRIYNPFPFSVKKGQLILPANQVKVFKNTWIHKLDPKIYYSRNSLGFRGPELPDSISSLLSVLTVGGSTTECKFQSDTCTWSYLLYGLLKKQNPAVWLNNAGIDGHSTFGHLLLMKEYVLKLKPKYVIFLTGINDEEIDVPDEFDRMNENNISAITFKGFLKSIINHTELGRTAFNFYHVQIAYKKGLIHREVNFAALPDNPVTAAAADQRLKSQPVYLKAYKERIDKLLTDCRQAGIRPILLTQPSMFGSYTDSATHVAMGNKWLIAGEPQHNLLLEEKVLELYNDVLRSYSPQITVVDLARQFPKNSLYYYDFIHYTNAGARKIAEILYDNLRQVILKPDAQ